MPALDLTSVETAKMPIGRLAMALFANEEEKKIEAGAEDGTKIAQAEQVAAKLGISIEDALPKINTERLPDGVEGFAAIKKRMLPQGFMAVQNKETIDIQAAIRIIQFIKGGLQPEASFDPKIFPDSTDAQRHFKGVLARRLPGIEAVKGFETNDTIALIAAQTVIQSMMIKYSVTDTSRPHAGDSLRVFAGHAIKLIDDSLKAKNIGNGAKTNGAALAAKA